MTITKTIITERDVTKTKQELAKKQEQYLSLKSNKTESNKKHNHTHIIVKKEEDSFH